MVRQLALNHYFLYVKFEIRNQSLKAKQHQHEVHWLSKNQM